MPEDLTPIPAATLVIFRERGEGPPELLMLERSAAMRFAGGAVVFPGGRVDAGDHAFAATLTGDPDDLAARVAAVRETIEEAGVAIGVDLPDLPAARRALYDGTPFAEVIAGARFDPAALVPFARWLPHQGVAHRIFDTRFYLARWPDGAPDPAVDGNENSLLFWSSARDTLAAADAGKVRMIFPTRRNLERLALFNSFDDAVADARAHRQDTITPWIEVRDGVDHLCIPEGLGYPVTAQPLTAALRA